jgi:O-acetyl-ADP-ribose deacetylase (regulator of RNase III)
MGQDLVTNANYIRGATQSALALGDRLGLSSVAMPAFGTGVGRFPVKECARIMIREAKRFTGTKSLRKVIFVLFDDDTLNAFQQEMQERD